MSDAEKRAKEKLNAFHRAAVAVLANWDDSLNVGYPFQQSFDEFISFNLDGWLDAVHGFEQKGEDV